MYVHGGVYGSVDWSVNYTSLDDLWCYVEAQDSWIEMPHDGSPPSPRFHHSMVNCGSQLVIFGGFNVYASLSEHVALGNVFAFDTASNYWTAIDTGGASPLARGGHSAAVSDTTMYVFGGSPSMVLPATYFQDLWKLSLVLWTWDLIMTSPGPEGRIGSLLFVIDQGHFFLTAGACAQICGSDWVLTIVNNSWQQLPSNRTARQDSAAAVGSGGIVFEFGGLPLDGTELQVARGDLYVFDGLNWQWMILFPNFLRGANPPPSSGHSLAMIGNRIILFGGRVESPASPGTNQLWKYQVVAPTE